MSTDLSEVIRLLTKISGQLEDLVTEKRPKQARRSDDERVALAVVAIAKGASTFQEIADQLGVSRGTVSKNPGIRRAMESSIRDRRPLDKEAAEDFRWHQ